MRLLVLGGSGFIGSHVVDALLAQGHAVRVFDRGPERFRKPLPGVETVFGDFRDRMLLLEALTGIDIVIHLISTTFPGTADLDPQADVTGNLLGTLELLEAMKSIGINRLVYLSSGGTVYGIPQTNMVDEDHPLRPVGSYGIVKVAIENYLGMFQRSHGLRPVIIRAANPFGPRQAHSGVQGVISTFLHKVHTGQPIEIWGDGSVVRDYLYVADLADLCARAVASEATGTVNAASGIGRSLSEIVDSIALVTGKHIEPVYKPGRILDVPRSVLECSRAKAQFGWVAETDFLTALAQTWQWVQNHGE